MNSPPETQNRAQWGPKMGYVLVRFNALRLSS